MLQCKYFSSLLNYTIVLIHWEKYSFQDLRNIWKFEYQVSIIIIIIYFYEFITQDVVNIYMHNSGVISGVYLD